jgi:N-acetylneuraminic acid mutarotase
MERVNAPRYRIATFAKYAAIFTFAALAGCGGGGGGNGGGGGAPDLGIKPPPTNSSASAPVIVTQPSARTVVAASSASFTVEATGNGTLSYAWRFNGTAIPNGTSATLSVTNRATPAHAGVYDCVITNSLNGTEASVTSAAVALTVVEVPALALTGEGAVLPNSAGHVVSTPQQQNVTYSWRIANGTITSGANTHEVTYTAGALGRVELILDASSIAGVGTAIKNVAVAAALPFDSIFAQPAIHPDTTGVLASAPAIDGQTHAWARQNLTATVDIVGSTTAPSLQYTSGAAAGTYALSLTTTDAANRSSNVTRTLNVVTDAFLKDARDGRPRTFHTATLLNDGRVLVVGGDAGVPDFDTVPKVGTQSRVLGSVEMFDPATRTWAAIDPVTPRLGHSATLLNDGRVLIVGGSATATGVLGSVQIFDPATRAWSAGTSLGVARAFHSATLLEDGRVLVIGGVDVNGAVSASEIYDPVANTWVQPSNMSVARAQHAVARMRDGNVLVAGGWNQAGFLASAEIYDVAANAWRTVAPLPSARANVGAALLTTDKVLVLGQETVLYDPVANNWTPAAFIGQGPSNVVLSVYATTAIVLPNGNVLATAPYIFSNIGQQGIYDPIAKSWRQLNARPGHYMSATLLADGTLLEIGGTDMGRGYAIAADYLSLGLVTIQNLTTAQRTTVGSNGHAGADAAATLLTGGRLLVTGGNTARAPQRLNATNAATTFDSQTGQWTSVATMRTARSAHTAVSLANNRALVIGGQNAHVGVFANAERYDAGTDTWQPAGVMSTPRYRHTSSVLNDGRVLVAGGSNSNTTCTCTTFQSSVDLYDPTANSWTATGDLITARYDHTSTVLPDGRVLVVGGFGGEPDTTNASGGVLASVEIYDPASGGWSAAASMPVARRAHTATLLNSGVVLVAGGHSGSATLNTAQVYDPATDTWSPVASMSTARQQLSSVRLANGAVLVVGGLNGSNSALFGVDTGEVYDPTANVWSAPRPMAVARQKFTASLLPDGRVVIVGGTPNYVGMPEFYR